ncbi:hypothetical protein VNO77_42967 [Canavalia gladiata]|uniref:Uncharacterized protein n=1 Tax=Canavalia gladiata TaxID=3824 RepID=A0AAN9JVP0_CANGL
MNDVFLYMIRVISERISHIPLEFTLISQRSVMIHDQFAKKKKLSSLGAFDVQNDGIAITTGDQSFNKNVHMAEPPKLPVSMNPTLKRRISSEEYNGVLTFIENSFKYSTCHNFSNWSMDDHVDPWPRAVTSIAPRRGAALRSALSDALEDESSENYPASPYGVIEWKMVAFMKGTGLVLSLILEKENKTPEEMISSAVNPLETPSSFSNPIDDGADPPSLDLEPLTVFPLDKEGCNRQIEITCINLQNTLLKWVLHRTAYVRLTWCQWPRTVTFIALWKGALRFVQVTEATSEFVVAGPAYVWALSISSFKLIVFM